MKKTLKVLALLIIFSSCSSDNPSEQPKASNDNPSTDRTCEINVMFISSNYRIDMWIPNLSGTLDTETLYRDNTIPFTTGIWIHKEYQNKNDKVFVFQFLNSSGSDNQITVNYNVIFNHLIDGFGGNRGSKPITVPLNKTLILKLDPTQKYSLITEIK